MSEQNIKCPKCGHTFPMTDAVREQIAEGLRAEFNQKWKDERARLETQIRKSADEAAAEKLTEIQRDLDASRAQVERQQKDRAALEAAMREQLAQEKTRAREAVALELKDKDEQLAEQKQKLQAAQEQELALRKKERELTERAANMELEMTRRLSEERGEIEAAARKRADDEHGLRLAEKDKQLADTLKQLEEAKRKLEQGSQQSQGEILELELEEQLRAHFPDDEILPVAKGVRGGDVIQRVPTPTGPCGILWEFKNTKNWTEGWISKLKQDQRECKADMAVIVTRALPKEIAGFGLREGVWVTDFASAIGLACVLRESLVQISYARTASEGMSYKMELIYKYLAGPEFQQRVEAIVENLAEMQKDLNDEMRRITKLWEKRQTQILVMQQSTIAIHGKLHAIIGNALSDIPLLAAAPEEDGAAVSASEGNGTLSL